MNRLKPFYVFIFCVTFAGSMCLSGCKDRTINPFGNKKGSFSIYGALSLNTSLNYVRVKDLTAPFFPDSVPKLDATVTFEDLQTGTTTTLPDTIVEFSGNYTHNFKVDHRIKPNGRYRILVKRPDGKSVSSVAIAPGIDLPSVSPSVNVACHQTVHIAFKNVKRPEYIQMKIGFFFNGTFESMEVGKIVKLTYKNNNEMVLDTSILNLLMEVFPDPKLGDPRFDQSKLVPTVLCNQLDTNEAVISYIHFGPEWAKYQSIFTGDPTKSFDVLGGLGFLGAFRRDTLTFTVDTTSAK